jgi:lipoate-protein ligase A
MAADHAIMAGQTAGQSPPTLHFYAWRPACVSLGKFQRQAETVDLERCRALGVDVVTRPTGGRAILHEEDEVTFSIIVPESTLGTSQIMDSYRILATGMVAGLRALGAEADLVERRGRATGVGQAPSGPGVNPACFAAKARCDLVVAGGKLVGSAQLRRDGVVLQQNSLPVAISFARWAEVFADGQRWVGGDAEDHPDAVGLRSVLGRDTTFGEVRDALVKGFETALDIRLEAGELTPGEAAQAEELRPQYLAQRAR